MPPTPQLPAPWLHLFPGGWRSLRVPKASVHSSVGILRESALAGSPPWGRLETSPAAPAANCRQPPGAHSTGSAPPSETSRLPWPALVRPVPELGCRACGASANCTCHRVPSTQLVSCLPLCGPGNGALRPSLLCPRFTSTGSAGPGPLLPKGPCKYVQFSGPGQWGGCPEPVFHALTCTIIFSKVLG